MSTVAEGIARQIQAAGVRTVFGLPGGEIVHVLEAIRRAGMEFQLVHHEASAVYMADAAARLTGGVGVCVTTLGPGAANAVVGAAHAFLDRSPVLILTAAVDDGALPARSHQHIDLSGLYSPITKASAALQPTGAEATLEAAFTIMQAGRPGPVHLSLSSQASLAQMLPGESAIQPEAPTANSIPESALELALRALEAAERPLIVAGLGLEPEAPYAQLRSLAEAARAPVVVTPKARGALSDDHPLAGGVIGLTRSDPAYALLDEADLILAVGLDVVELVRSWHQAAPLVWLAHWPNEGPTLPAEFELVGALRPTLQRLAGGEFEDKPEWGEDRVRRFRRQYIQPEVSDTAAEALAPQHVLASLRAALPAQTIVSTDVGSHKILAGLTWPMIRPNRYLVANGLSPMGFGLPAAIAAAGIEPKTPILCLIGDGGLAMSLGELGLLARLDSPLIVAVLRDDALDLIRSHQRRAGYDSYGTEFQGPDWAAIGRAYGLLARRAETVEEIAEAVAAAIESSKPMLLEIPIDPASYPTTPGAS